MAPVRFNSDAFEAFLQSAATSNIVYHASRRALFDLFVSALSSVGDLQISVQSYLPIRTFLSSRSAVENDSARLAYEVALLECSEAFHALKEVQAPVPTPAFSQVAGPVAQPLVMHGFPYEGPRAHPTE